MIRVDFTLNVNHFPYANVNTTALTCVTQVRPGSCASNSNRPASETWVLNQYTDGLLTLEKISIQFNNVNCLNLSVKTSTLQISPKFLA